MYNENSKLQVVNLWGGPGAGKSLNAAGLFNIMKRKYIQVELVTEYAKDLVWSQRNNMFTEQDYIFAKQHHRLRRLVNKVSYAITDSPLAMGLLYLPKDYPKTFAPFVKEVFNSYLNVNIFIQRNHPYDPNGRNQSEEESKIIDQEIRRFLTSNGIPFYDIISSDNTSEEIFNLLTSENIIK